MSLPKNPLEHMTEASTSIEEKKPFVVHCGDCNHEWAPAYLPMEITKLAGIFKRASCPMCRHDRKIFVGKAKHVAV